MKKLRQWKKQLIGAVVMAAVTVPMLLFAMSDSSVLPTLSFEAAGIRMVEEDGGASAQLLVNVYLRDLDAGEESDPQMWADSVHFELYYNGDYLVPSDYDTNDALHSGTIARVDPDKAFRANPIEYELINADETTITMKDPFERLGLKATDSSGNTNFLTANYLAMTLATRRGDNINLTNAKLERRVVSEGDQQGSYLVFTERNALLLGTLSFRITDIARIPEIVNKFGKFEKATDPVIVSATDPDDKDFLFCFVDTDPPANPMKGYWRIGAIRERKEDNRTDYEHVTLDNYDSYGADEAYREARAWFTFGFEKTLIGVEAAEADLTINAYQAYTNGDVGDLSIALQTYSPTIIATYSDGSKRSFAIPWGSTDTPWTADKVTTADGTGKTVVDTVADGEAQVKYDPTGGEYYIEKYFWYTEEVDNGDGTTTPTSVRFPAPVKVKLTVTPVTLVDVTAEDLYKVYDLTDDLVSNPTTGVIEFDGLKLPKMARLVTDVPVGSSLTMPIPGWSHLQDGGNWPLGGNSGKGNMASLWKDGADVTTSAYLHWPTKNDMGTWDDTDASDATNNGKVGDNRAGTYTFNMASGDGGAATNYTRTDIQAVYPWLTVKADTSTDSNYAEYTLAATRRIALSDGGTERVEVGDNYTATYVSTTVNGDQPVLTLNVSRKNPTSGRMYDNSHFRIKLPDGTEVDTTNWFANTGRYIETRAESGMSASYNLTLDPGDPTVTNSYTEARERLRRYINLGGWLYVAVQEGPDATGNTHTWTDFIPVFVPPRDNYYEENKVYNFIGPNAGLFPWPGGVGTTVHVPNGSYETVDPSGAFTGLTERYGVKTTYDGLTGAQPGELHTFTIYPDSGWTTAASTSGSVTTTTYGPNEFLDDTLYTEYAGRVRNTEERNPETTTDANRKATIRIEEEGAKNSTEQLSLHYVSTTSNNPMVDTDGSGADYDVTKVTYETQRVGYTTRQEYVLRIDNDGDTDIYGLDIDTLSDLAHSGDGSGHFVVIKPPASVLPAGQSTYFTLTYVYDLQPRNRTDLDYIDKLYITSSSKNDVAGGDYLLDFDAQFQVSDRDIHTVTFVIKPDLSAYSIVMGSAQTIVGLPTGTTLPLSDLTFMNTTARSATYAANTMVYFMVTPNDEYAINSIEAEDSVGTDLTTDINAAWTDYLLSAADGSTFYSFTMPDHDVTVTIKFHEPISSKLRLSDLTTYADNSTSTLKPYPYDPSNPPTGDYTNVEYKVWQKTFEDEDLTALTGSENEIEMKKMTMGRAETKGYSQSCFQYLVVIPQSADYSQVEATLRKITYELEGQNQNLSPVTVQMNLYQTTGDAYNNRNPEDIYNTARGTGTADLPNGDTNVPTVHTSTPFASPDPGASKYVRIDMSYIPSGTSTAVVRSYYVEIHRRPDSHESKLNYGNSPYGMIMNASNINKTAAFEAGDTDEQKAAKQEAATKEAKDAAKAAFVANRYSFDGLGEYIPNAVNDQANMKTIHYWTEAWIAPEAQYDPSNYVDTRYEPESHTGFVANTANGTWSPDSDIYKESDNLDLNDYAFFATMGAEFTDPGINYIIDSSGRRAILTDATMTLEAYTLNVTAASQWERFGLPLDASGELDTTGRTVTLTLGKAASTVTDKWATPGDAESSLAAGVYLRPGRYMLTYTIPDFDYDDDPTNNILTVTRDFVVLAPVGDVNADLQVVTDATVTTGVVNDEALVKGRVTTPLGYIAHGYKDNSSGTEVIYSYADGAIFKLRTCDANNDRNINNIDANAIAAAGTDPVEQGSSGIRKVNQYYLPTDYIK